ncbi:MAG: hypothetical protein ABI646_01385, partial [Acidobacteriota bacterium]
AQDGLDDAVDHVLLTRRRVVCAAQALRTIDLPDLPPVHGERNSNSRIDTLPYEGWCANSVQTLQNGMN